MRSAWGKDSLAACLAVREARVEVRPFHLYLVPELAFMDESVAFFEDYIDTAIPQLPHPSLYGLDPDVTFTADGIRAADSPNCRTALKGHAMRRSLVNVSGAMIRGAARRLGIRAAGSAGGRSSGT